MQWQDWVFSIGGFIVAMSLIPTLRGDQKPALTTALMTAVLIAIFGVTMATLGLWLSAAANFLNSVAWFVIAYQRYQLNQQLTHRGVIQQFEDDVEEAAHGHHESPETRRSA